MSVQRCCHVKINGARCTMPAVNGDEFCYHHSILRAHKRTKPMPPSTARWMSTPLFNLRYPDTYDDLIYNAHLALDAFVRHDIDYRQLTTVTHQIETVRKCLVAAERHRKLQKPVEDETPVAELRPDPDQEGELLALPGGQPVSEPVSDPGKDVSAAAAQAPPLPVPSRRSPSDFPIYPSVFKLMQENGS